MKVIWYMILTCIFSYGYYKFIYLNGRVEHFEKHIHSNLDERLKKIEQTEMDVTSLLEVLAKTMTGMNRETMDSFKDTGEILYDTTWLNDNKAQIKSTILQYLTDKDLSEDADSSITIPLKHQNVQVIDFIFVNKDNVVSNPVKSGLVNSLVIMDTEISDVFDVPTNNEEISKNLYSELSNKNESFFVEKITKFRNSYLKKTDDKISIKSGIEDDWLKAFPTDRSYDDVVMNHITKKLGYFVGMIS